MLQTESRAGDYQILEVVQRSKREVVYRVRNVVANRMEAMKVLPESLQNDNEALERFFREIKVLSRLIHPNIVAFYHATQLNGSVVMTTELLECQTLAERLQDAQISLRNSVDIVQQVLAALSHAHNHAIVHREVTPDNIYVLPGGSVKLGGFALAKPKGDMNLTKEGVTLGTVAYMSPEQVKGVATIDHRADIYAVGCVLYELLTGKQPFSAKSDFDVMLAHVQRDPVPAMMLNREIPHSVQQVINKAMAKDPAERYSSALSFSSSLEEAFQTRREPQRVRSEKLPDRPATPVKIPIIKPVTSKRGKHDWYAVPLLGAALVVTALYTLSIVFK